ncbi:ANK1 [Symbiodinium sp. CCMP2456]|nr:ANK1 [Symbiodinium sp. CCMP2456]
MSAARLLLALLALATGKRIYTREQDTERMSAETFRSFVKGLQGFPEDGLQAMLEEVPVDRDGLMRSSAVLRFLQDRGSKDQARRKERLAAMERSFVASLEAQAKELFQKLRQDEEVHESLPTTTTTTTSLQPLAMAVKEAASKDVGVLAAHRAAIHNRAATLRFLHEVGVSIHATDKFGQTPAHVAAKKGNVEALEALHEAGADMEAADNAGDTPLHAAAFYCEVKAVRFLIQAGVNTTAVNKNGKTPADISACAYEQEVELLLQDDPAQSLQPTATTNTTSPSPTTTRVKLLAISVREAACAGNVSALAELRKAGANLGAKLLPIGHWQSGWTAAHYAAAYNRSAALWFLHEVGVDLNATTDDGSLTPAHLAAKSGYVAPLEELHQAGADMEKADDKGDTPLHIAARKGWVGAVRFLIQAGVNTSAVNFQGKTPIDCARGYRWSHVAKLLEAHTTTTTAPSWGSTSGDFEADNRNATTGQFEGYHGYATTGHFEASDGYATTGQFEASKVRYATTGKFEA